jgi:hypothetical protein
MNQNQSNDETGADYWRDAGSVHKDFKRKCATRRMARVQLIKPELQALCAQLGIKGEVKNNGIHWQFSKNGIILNFYPTTNRITFQGEKSQGKHGNSLPGGVRFTFNNSSFQHRKPIIVVALKELGGIRFVRGENNEPPKERSNA